MSRKLIAFFLMAAFSLAALPAGGSKAEGQRAWRTQRTYTSDHGRYRYYGADRRWRKGKKKRYWGYKNYGQYRRTQVGNRRYRYERRYYWRDGSRFSRLVRIFY